MDATSWQPSTPYRQIDACPDTGAVCICSEDYVATDKNANGENVFQPQSGSVACQPFRFQVGDVIFFEKPKGQGPAFFQANTVARFTNSPIIHSGIVSYVPPEETKVQNADDIIVTEALKGNYKTVTQQTLRHVIQRWNFGAYQIRRVAPTFDSFKSHSQDITTFLNGVKDQDFDSDMMMPGKKEWGTNGRYIDPRRSVACGERQRAFEIFKTGGPGKWMCSQLVEWTLAFAGGLNLDYSPDDHCTGPGWTITDLQEWPGRLLGEYNLWDPSITWRMPCNNVNCFIGAPTSARWAGGRPPVSAATPAPATAAPVTGTPAPDGPVSVHVDGLPHGWKAAKDAPAGRIYYYNQADPRGSTTWTRPGT
jgi:hypothetical protein